MTADRVPPGQDTPTGTDPAAKYDHPGYEDKSLGQAVNQDMELADDLVAESDGDYAAAEKRFERESAGAPALARQASEPPAAPPDSKTDQRIRPQVEEDMAQADLANGENEQSPQRDGERHTTGEAAARRNRENDPPA